MKPTVIPVISKSGTFFDEGKSKPSLSSKDMRRRVQNLDVSSARSMVEMILAKKKVKYALKLQALWRGKLHRKHLEAGIEEMHKLKGRTSVVTRKSMSAYTRHTNSITHIDVCKQTKGKNKVW